MYHHAAGMHMVLEHVIMPHATSTTSALISFEKQELSCCLETTPIPAYQPIGALTTSSSIL